MLRIGITCYPTHGGSGVIATELGKLLAERGHFIHFITYDMPFRLGNFHENIRYHEVETNSYDLFKYPPYDLSLASKMAQVAKSHKLDILHVHYAVPHAVAAILAKQMINSSKLKVITTLHGTDITVLGHDHALKEVIRYGIEKSDIVTGVSNSLIKRTYDLFPMNKQIELVYNFVDQRMYYPRDVRFLREKYVKPHENLLLHISNFRQVKRVKDVIGVFDQVNKTLPSKLLLVGEGPELTEIIELVKNLGLTSKVIFLERQSEVSELISLADVLLLPSQQESFGLVAIEAMACGVPVVASNAGGLPEVILDGVTGSLSDIGDVRKMGEDVIKLLLDKERYQQFSHAGMKRIETHFSGETIVKQYENIYYQVLKHPKTFSGKLFKGRGKMS